MSSSTTNYFKAAGHSFFFTDSVPESVEAAYVSAQAVAQAIGGAVSVFLPTQLVGEWDSCPLIGHRPRSVIVSDLELESNPEERKLLRLELHNLDGRFYNAGRSEIPSLQQAA